MKMQVGTILLLILTLPTYSFQIPSLAPQNREIRTDSFITSTELSLNQTVVGTLTYTNQQASYGIHLPAGQYNITLQVGPTANLGFQVFRWFMGIPTLSSVASIPPPGVGKNSSYVLLLPTITTQTPGDYVILVFPQSVSTLGSYRLRVQQIASFQPMQLDQQVSFIGWRNDRALLYEAIIPQFGTYNITMTTNGTASFAVTTYEDEVYLPFSGTLSSNGRISFLAPLRSGDVYIEATPNFASNINLEGSISVNSTSTPTITPSSTLQATVPLLRETYFYADLTPGYYYSITLEVPEDQNLNLRVYSPTSGQAIAQSSNAGFGLQERISNLVVFLFNTYAVGEGKYQRTSVGPPGPMPDRILIGVRNESIFVSPALIPFNLTLTQQPFPTLTPNSPTNVYLNSTAGPHYRFYRSTQNSPSVYNVSYQHEVWGAGLPWSGTLQLSAAEKIFKLAVTSSSAINILFLQHGFFTPESFRDAADRWIGESPLNSTSNSYLSSRNQTMGSAVFAYMESAPIIIGVKLLNTEGHTAYNGTLSYTSSAPGQIQVGTPRDDYLRSNQISLFEVTLQAGHTYRIRLQYTSMAILSTLYSTAGLLQATATPVLTFFLTSDPDLPENEYYYLFTPTMTDDYYIANSGPIIFGGTPEGSYTLLIQEQAPPSLSLTIDNPPTQKLGQPFTLEATITNNGDYTAENVELSLTLPGSLTSTSSPTATVGSLAPSTSIQVTWTLNSSSPGEYGIDLQASSSNSPTAHAPSSILITAPQLQVTISAPASTSAGGGTFQVAVNVKNIGNEAAGSTTVRLTLPSGLSTTPPTQTITSITPGQTQTVTWTVNAETSGDYTIIATANEQYAGSTTINTSLSVPPPWPYYVLIAAIASLLAAFLGGFLFASRRERKQTVSLPPPK